MLIEGQVFETTWNNMNKDWYISKGYNFTKRGDSLMVKVEDLMHGSRIRVRCICDYCGEEYSVYYYQYYNGHKKHPKDACSHCAGKKTSEISLERRIEHNYSRCLDVCAKYGYRLISDKSCFDNVRENMVQIECPKHGIFEMRIESVINGRGCPLCGRESVGDKLRIDPKLVKQEIESYNDNILLNTEEYKEAHCPNLKIKCGKCGNVFVTSLQSYRKTDKVCHECGVSSRGEKYIKEYLDEHNVSYIEQKRFDDCRNIKPLPFDFYLNDLNIAIEFQGKQHYMPVDYFGGEKEFNNRLYLDSIKKEYCIKNNIPLIEIKYNQIEEINDILNKKLNFA